MIVAGSNTEVTGGGSTTNPYVVSAIVRCEDVRPCISAGPGVDYDPATGVVGVDISPQPGNNVVVAPDGGLYVPTGSATVTTGCGLVGDGSASAPVEVATGAWPFPCDVDTAGAGVYCGTDGMLRSEPLPKAGFVENSLALSFPSLPAVPVAEVPVASLDASITNPDPCREALVIAFHEIDVDFNYPPGGEGGCGIDGDDMVHMANKGNATTSREHVQVSKLVNLVLAPGETRTHGFQVTLSRGANGATYSRIQGTLRAWVISNPS